MSIGEKVTIGVDEAGRGPLFGDVYTSAVILPDPNEDDFDLTMLKDMPQTVLPQVMPSAEPVWHLFPWRTQNRDAVQKKLSNQGVTTLIHYPTPPHLADAYTDLGYEEGDFPVAEMLAAQELSLPIGPHLSLDSATCVVETLRQNIAV